MNFQTLIGKRIYRKKGTCNCTACREVKKNGLIVRDKYHAKYLEMISGDMQIEYFLKKPL